MSVRHVGLTGFAIFFLGIAAAAQQPNAANPITALIKVQAGQFGNNITRGAEEMPAEKFTFKPSPDVRTFGQLMQHVAQFNDLMCSRLSDQQGPDVKGLKDTDGEDKLVAAVKKSFEFCTQTIDGLDDAKLGQPFNMSLHSAGSLSGKLTRGQGLVILAEDWFDHYSTEATYLRMNRLLPPSAERK